MKDHTKTTIPGPLPTCDVCKESVAKYDAKTTHGPWAYLCQADFDKMGVGLGLGLGQELVTA